MNGRNPFDEDVLVGLGGGAGAAAGSRNPFRVAADDDDDEQIGRWGVETTEGSRREPKFYEIGYYGAYFDLTLSDFLQRNFRALLPVTPLLGWTEVVDGPQDENPTPDLYGPLWLTTTLVLSLSVGSNLATFLRGAFTLTLPESVAGLDFQKLWRASVILYGYTFLAPMVLFLLQVCSSIKVSFFDSLCVYGYSFTPVVIAAIVSIIPLRTLQFCFMGAGFLISTWFIMFNLWRSQTVEHRSLAYFVRFVSGLGHLALGAVVTFLFFA